MFGYSSGSFPVAQGPISSSFEESSKLGRLSVVFLGGRALLAAYLALRGEDVLVVGYLAVQAVEAGLHVGDALLHQLALLLQKRLM